MSSKSIETKEDLVAYLNKLNVGVISTIMPDRTPYAAVIYFVVDHNLNFYFITKSDTKKVVAVRKNNHAALTTIDLSLMTTMQSTGIVEEIEYKDQYRYFLKTIGEVHERKNKPHWPLPISRLRSSGDVVAYKYIPTWLRISDYSKKKSSDDKSNKDIFHQIIPEH